MGCEGEVSCVTLSGELDFVLDCDSTFSLDFLERELLSEMMNVSE